MKKKASKRARTRIVRGIIPTTAIASGMLSPAAIGAPGDLDPTFGDMGRVAAALKFDGPAWSLQPLSGNESLFAGGATCDYYCSYYHQYPTGFIGHLSDPGSLDWRVADAILKEVQVRDLALQPDGKFIAVGQGTNSSNRVLTVIRLEAGGALDTTFANGGVMQLTTLTSATAAQSVTLDPSGAIVVAGSGAGNLIVLRLLANGTLDPSFADAGVFQGPRNDFSDTAFTNILRTASGGYRISTNFYDTTGECRVIGLTAAGKIDGSFAASGTAAVVPTSGASVTCDSMIAQSDGGLVLAGSQNGHGFAMRLLASGKPDASFAASPVPLAMDEASAVALDAGGNVLIAGRPPTGVPGALVMRLHADGTLDGLFGNAGTAWIDLPSTDVSAPLVHGMSVLSDGRILAAGGDQPVTGGTGPFVVRLLGTAGSAGPGVIGATPSSLTVKEKDKTATVTVRRTGGAAGAVSVTYKTADYTGSDVPTATAGKDYTPVSGQLTWADGDRTDRQIAISIATDTGAVVEESERFLVSLANAQGGAELGTGDAVVEILGDGDPVGQFDFEASPIAVSEADGVVTLWVDRRYYSQGATSVTLTPIAGSATTADFAGTPITLSWADGDLMPKSATIAITKSQVSEPAKSFTVQLSNATNGALIGPHSVATVQIAASTPTPPTPPTPPPPSTSGGGGGGGGALDWFTIACLSMVRWLRRRVS